MSLPAILPYKMGFSERALKTADGFHNACKKNRGAKAAPVFVNSTMRFVDQ
jgi:hypothetical protein